MVAKLRLDRAVEQVHSSFVKFFQEISNIVEVIFYTIVIFLDPSPCYMNVFLLVPLSGGGFTGYLIFFVIYKKLLILFFFMEGGVEN